MLAATDLLPPPSRRRMRRPIRPSPTRAFGSSEAWPERGDLERERPAGSGVDAPAPARASRPTQSGRSSRSGEAGADGVERSERRMHERRIETTFGTVRVARAGYARAGVDSLHPLDAALNLPAERYSLEVRGHCGCVAFVRRSALGVVPQYRRAGAPSGGAVGASGGCGRRLLRGASGGRGPAGCGRLDRRADLRQQGCRAAPPGPARGDAQGGREAPAATRGLSPFQR